MPSALVTCSFDDFHSRPKERNPRAVCRALPFRNRRSQWSWRRNPCITISRLPVAQFQLCTATARLHGICAHLHGSGAATPATLCEGKQYGRAVWWRSWSNLA